MKTLIEFLNTKVIVKPEQGIVVYKATVKFKDRKAYNLFDNLYLYSDEIQHTVEKHKMIKLHQERTFYGVAKCKPGEKFDETLGRRLAESRCKQKIFRSYTKLYESMRECFINSLTKFDEMIGNTLHAWHTEVAHEETLIENGSTVD